MGEVPQSALAATQPQRVAPIDVNRQAGPSPADGAIPNLQSRPTPAAQQQAAQAQALAQVAAAPVAAVPGLVEKDQALADQAARIQELEGNKQFLEGKLTALIDSQTQAPPPPPPEPEKQPPGFEQLPPEDQMRWYAKQEAQTIVHQKMTEEREALKASIGPILQKVGEHDANLVEQSIRQQFPNLPFDDYRPALDKLAREMPAMDPMERAASVAVKAGHPEHLLPAAVTAPVVESGLPSMSAAAGQPRVRQQPTGPTRADDLATAADLIVQNRKVQAAPVLDRLLHRHVQAQARVAALKQQARLTGG